MLIYLLMAVVLAFRPQGLFRRAEMRHAHRPLDRSPCCCSSPCRRWCSPSASRSTSTCRARILILAIAAVSLNLILGYGGLVSFGHAAYLGIGAYTVGILGFYGITSGWLQWPVAIVASALVALAIGAVSIRTSGVYFIMITLAFTQMLYYLGISIAEFGGDDGMRLKAKSQFRPDRPARPGGVLLLVPGADAGRGLLCVHRLVNSRFGMVLRASKSNDARTRAIGFSPYPYRLAAFVIAGAMCGLAGALLRQPHQLHHARPDELAAVGRDHVHGDPRRHGDRLGPGARRVRAAAARGPALTGWTQHWQVILGPLLVLSVIFFRRGLAGIFYKPDA